MMLRPDKRDTVSCHIFPFAPPPTKIMGESSGIPEECLFKTSNDSTSEYTTPSYAASKISPDVVE